MKKRIYRMLVSVFCCMLGLCAFSSCRLFYADRNKLLDAYTSEDSFYQYYTFKATIKSVRQSPTSDAGWDRFYKFEVDHEYFEEQFGHDEATYEGGAKRWERAFKEFGAWEFNFTPENYEIVSKNGGFELLEEGAEVMITSNDYSQWHPWKFPILGLSIGDTTYLEFETGKENFLDYVRENWREFK